uniref:DB domain-containing protein n=1 Tax=Elaeophora elaphi TaxID=1147741 RepID=A0A0R3RT20_9BILA
MLHKFGIETSIIKSYFLIGFTLSLPSIVSACYANGICGGLAYCQPVQLTQQAFCDCAPSYGCGQYGCYKLRARASKNMKLSPLDNGQQWSKGSLLQFDKNLNEPSMLVPADQFQLGKSIPLRVLDERRALAMASPTAAKLPTKGRTFQNPNEAFLECCMDRQLPDACLNKCNFNSYNRQSLMLMYLHQDPCPMKAMREMQFCAAQGRDHRPCCLRNGITTTLAGAKCLTFCNQTPGKVTQLDMSFLPCFDRFENMKACFWHDIIRYFR